MNTRASRAGFTLIELLLVITIIAIIASIAVPNLISAKTTTNEGAAISTLRNLSSLQIAVQNRKFIDLDTDGQGEYGYFGELSGAIPARNAAGAALLPPLLAASFRLVNAGIVTKGGYHYIMFLPDNAGAGLLEAPGNYANVDPDLAELAWCAYAWPATVGSSGRRAFFVNQVGEVLATSNTVNNYSGTAGAPTFDAAFAVAGSMMGVYDPSVPAVDGGLWISIQP